MDETDMNSFIKTAVDQLVGSIGAIILVSRIIKIKGVEKTLEELHIAANKHPNYQTASDEMATKAWKDLIKGIEIMGKWSPKKKEGF